MGENDESGQSAFGANPDQVRAGREAAALSRLTERFKDAAPPHPSAFDAIRSTVASASAGTPPEVTSVDLLAALTLLPRVRAEVDGLEAGLLFLAREQGMSWAEIAFGMGLGSPQAAQQRSERTQQRAGGKRAKKS